MIRLKSYCPGALMRASDTFKKVVRDMEMIFQVNFSKFRASHALGSELCSLMKREIDFSFLFQQHAEHALLLQDRIPKIYTAMRIFYAVKFMNKAILQPANKKCDERVHNRKVKKVSHK